MCASASTFAAPPMSFFMISMPLVGLMSSPPVSKHTPLPTSVTFGCVASPQRELDQPRRACVGGAADRVDQRKVLLQQIVADDARNFAPCCSASARAAASSSAGPMSLAGVLMRSRASVTASADAAQLVAVDAVRAAPGCTSVRLRLAVAGEAVGAEREGERGEARIVRRVGEAIGAGRQQPGKRPGRNGSRPWPARPPGRTARRRCRPLPTADSRYWPGLGSKRGGLDKGAARAVEPSATALRVTTWSRTRSAAPLVPAGTRRLDACCCSTLDRTSGWPHTPARARLGQAAWDRRQLTSH